MIIRLTGKLAKQLGFDPMDSLPLAENLYVDWTCRGVEAGAVEPVMLITNTASLYSLLARAMPRQSIHIRPSKCNYGTYTVHFGGTGGRRFKSSHAERGFERLVLPLVRSYWEMCISGDVQSARTGYVSRKQLDAQIHDSFHRARRRLRHLLLGLYRSSRDGNRTRRGRV